MSQHLIMQSLETTAERGGDIAPLVYEKYFAANPDAGTLMHHVDEAVKGRMMDELYRLLLVEDYGEEGSYLNWEVDNHQVAYSVKPQMYEGLFAALRDTVRHYMGSDWTESHAQAWQRRIEQLHSEILVRFARVC